MVPHFTNKVLCGNFVKRQTADSGYSHFNGSWPQLEQLTANQMVDSSNVHKGYRDGVILVDLPTSDENLIPLFYSSIIALNDKSKLIANYSPRREGENSYIRVSAKGNKKPARYASVVLYRWDVLDEGNERETNAQYEIVAIKARVSEQEEPMDPMTMARNFLHMKGGTKGFFTAREFAESIVYWNSHCLISSAKKKWYNRFLDFIIGK